MGAPALRDDVATIDGLQTGDEVIALLKKDPITNYPWWARWLLLSVYWLTNYDGGIELVTVCTSEQEAEAFAKHAGYRGIWLFLNKPLPDEPCQWRPAIHFKSPFRTQYAHYVPDMVAVNKADFAKLVSKTEELLTKTA